MKVIILIRTFIFDLDYLHHIRDVSMLPIGIRVTRCINLHMVLARYEAGCRDASFIHAMAQDRNDTLAQMNSLKGYPWFLILKTDTRTEYMTIITAVQR